MTAVSILSAKNLQKRYGRRTAVENVSLELRQGEIVGLLGPNGAGKTTCFYMLVGLVAADGGQILLDGRDMSRHNMHRRARQGIGYLPQEASVFRRMSVRDNLLSVLELRSDLDGDERQETLDRLLDELRVRAIADQPAMSLSGGERRRVEIARALAAAPRFILLDEPFAGVDPLAIGDLQDVLRQLHGKGIGVLITDHNVRETLRLCDRAYIIADGKVLTEGSPSSLLADRRVRESYLGSEFRL